VLCRKLAGYITLGLMGAEVFASPFFVALAVAFAAALTWAQSPWRWFSLRQVIGGYSGLVLACFVVAVVSGYVSPEEAASRWKVPVERYWDVQIRSILVEFMLLSCVAVVGTALVGLTVVRVLWKRGRATIPMMLATSVAVSLVFAAVLSSTEQPAFRAFATTAQYLVCLHLFLCLAFCVGARLPWRRVRHET
jgi:hypothetical protein